MLKRYFGFFISFFLILFTMFIAFTTRSSFIDNTIYTPNSLLAYTVQVDEKPMPYYDDSINTLDSLFKESELIVKVKPSTIQRIQSKSILSEALVTDVYKGDMNLLNTTINVYEYGFIAPNSQSYVSPNGYITMNSNNEYILFLKHPTPASVYGENFYVPLNRKYSKYSFNSSDYINYTENIKFKDIYNYNIILNNDEEIERYTNIRNSLLLKIHPKK